MSSKIVTPHQLLYLVRMKMLFQKPRRIHSNGICNIGHWPGLHILLLRFQYNILERCITNRRSHRGRSPISCSRSDRCRTNERSHWTCTDEKAAGCRPLDGSISSLGTWCAASNLFVGRTARCARASTVQDP